jgi:hypothetical protein
MAYLKLMTWLGSLWQMTWLGSLWQMTWLDLSEKIADLPISAIYIERALDDLVVSKEIFFVGKTKESSKCTRIFFIDMRTYFL